MSFLSKEDILNPDLLKSIELDVPELGGKVRIREMTGAERDALEFFVIQRRENNSIEQIRARVVACSLVDEQGKLLFPNPDDIEALGKVGWRALERIRKATESLNAIAKEDVEELRKN